jgi:phosphoribosyl-AMP cyclohydrolase|tara:strand:- start:5587 stop:5982 length:396 start_codon:yes stop_codon:yes gene_type:complete
MSKNITPNKLVAVYKKIRAKRSELSAEFKEQDSVLVAQLDKVKAAMNAFCDDNGVESVRTEEGLFYRTTKTRYWTSDWESMHGFILEHSVPELLDKRVNQSNMKQFLEENPDLVPMGLNADSEYVVTVRKK